MFGGCSVLEATEPQGTTFSGYGFRLPWIFKLDRHTSRQFGTLLAKLSRQLSPHRGACA